MPSQQFASAKKRVGSSSTFFRSPKAKTNQSFKIVPRGVNKRHICVAQRGFSAQVEIKIGIRRDEKIRFARTNSSSGNPP